MDDISQNKPLPHVSTMHTTYASIIPENINPGQMRELARFDSYDPEGKKLARFHSYENEVYLTPRRLIDQRSPDVVSGSTLKGSKHEDENTRENILGQTVPRRQNEHLSVQDEVDEDGYTLTTINVIDAPKTALPSSNKNSTKQKQNNNATCCKRHRFAIATFFIGFLLAGIIAYIFFDILGNYE